MESILVLNADYTPINITDLKRAFNLLYKGKAEIIKHNIITPIITEIRNYKRPTIIRLLKYITIPFRKVNLNRQNIFRRDKFKCGYCGEKTKNKLTIDHVIAKSKGGKNTWQNLVTCCKSCNIKKDDKSLEEVNMVLNTIPYRPTYIQFVKNITISYKDDWLPFLV
jgi:5-methylcytosine-specific restriction endonuclease McrA